MKKNKLLVVIIILLAAAALAVISYLVLPDTLVMQITFSGQAGNTMPKLAGIAIPFSVTLIFTVLYSLRDGAKKYLYISLLGIVMSVITLLMNI